MVHELLPEMDVRVFRPSIILRDSRFPGTTQFDMVRAFVWLAQLPVPSMANGEPILSPRSMSRKEWFCVHAAAPKYDTYHLGSGWTL